MSEGRKLLLLVLFTCVAFVYIAYAIPQVKNEMKDMNPIIGTTPEELIAAGERICASERAQCLTCHTLGDDAGARCPNLEEMGALAPTRSPGVDAAVYLLESLYDPDVFIVSGYPKNQMNPVNKPPIVLSHDEILALVCYLNSMGGMVDEEFLEHVKEEQDSWRKGRQPIGDASDGDEEPPMPILPGKAERGRDLFFSRGCAGCHKIEGLGAEKGPDLSAIGSSQSPEYIIESILEPRAVIVKGYEKPEAPMQTNFPDILTPQELYDVVAYLQTLRGKMK